MTDYRKVLEEVGANSQELAKLNPEYISHYNELMNILAKSDATDAVTRELLILAVAVTQRCEACIAVHVDLYIKAGGNREKLSDLANILILMDGGPGMVYAGKVLACYDQFTK